MSQSLNSPQNESFGLSCKQTAIASLPLVPRNEFNENALRFVQSIEKNFLIGDTIVRGSPPAIHFHLNELH